MLLEANKLFFNKYYLIAAKNDIECHQCLEQMLHKDTFQLHLAIKVKRCYWIQSIQECGTFVNIVSIDKLLNKQHYKGMKPAITAIFYMH